MCSINIAREDERGWTLRAYDAGERCIGTLSLRRWSECYCIGVAFGLLVDAAHRRKRVANTLMLRAEEIARINGMSLLMSTIRIDNLASIALVTMLGWASPLGEVHNPKSGNDLRVYVKSIADAVFPPVKDVL